MDYKFSQGLDVVFKQSKSEARRLKSEFLNTEHLLLGIIKTENSAKEILQNLNVDLTQIKRKIESLNTSALAPFAEETANILNNFFFIKKYSSIFLL